MSDNEWQPTLPEPPWHIRPYRSGDEEQILALFRRTFGKDLTLDEWQWKYATKVREGDAHHMWVAALPEGERLVGHYAGIPCRLKLNARVVEAFISVDTMTDPDFRRQGMLTQFGKIVYEAWAEAGYACIVGLPNQQWGSRKEALGWRTLFPLSWFRFPLRVDKILAKRGGPLSYAQAPLRMTSNLWLRRAVNRAERLAHGQAIVIRPYDGPEGVFDRIWQAASPSWVNALLRDDAWVKWRYAEAKPVPYDIVIAWRGGEPVGYIASRVLGTPSQRNGYIADIFTACNDTAASAALIAHALETLREKGAGIGLTLAIRGTPLAHTLRKLGFFGTPPETSFSYEIVPLAYGLSELPVGGADNWHAAGGDSDVI